jgi:hypothetical protein
MRPYPDLSRRRATVRSLRFLTSVVCITTTNAASRNPEGTGSSGGSAALQKSGRTARVHPLILERHRRACAARPETSIGVPRHTALGVDDFPMDGSWTARRTFQQEQGESAAVVIARR